jgi:predicted RNase H-like nuclease (RuvC/YqgF family)
LEAFSKEAVASALEQKRVGQGDLVFLVDASGGGKNTAELLAEQGIAGVITDSDMVPAVREHFLDRGIPVFSSKELPVQRIDGLPFVRPEDVDAAQARWEDQMKARQAKRQAERLESIFQEYRVERKREEKRLRK